MFKKRALIAILTLVLIFSNGSMAYGMEAAQQEDLDVTGEAIDMTTTPEAVSTGDAIDKEEKPTDENTIVKSDKEKKISTKATTYKYYVKNITTSGTTNIKTLSGTQKNTVITEANTYMKDLFNGKCDDKSNNAKYKSGRGLVVMDSGSKVINMISGLAYFKSSGATANIGNTYITPKDALHFYSTSSYNTKAKVGVSGAIANVNISSIILVPTSLVDKSGFYYKDYYTKSASGDLYHYVYKIKSPTTSKPYKSGIGGTSSYSVHTVDKAPGFMKIGTKYYSLDGINYYTNNILSSKAGTYYPYFKWLPYRTRSNYSSTNLNKWINYKTVSISPTSKVSKLKNQGRNLINSQDRYGVNAVNELAFACLESAYGKSNYALNRNNLFGINAVDSNPNNAYSFSTVGSCIKQHTLKYISKGYGDVKTDSRYHGLAPGNKAVGINVKYASDPWHGEKIAGIAYAIDKYLGGKDHKKYTIGVTNKNSVTVYKSAGSGALYNLSNKSAGSGPTGIPVVILGTSGSFYKIQSDLPVSGNNAKYSLTYYYNKSIAYVKKSDITKVSAGKHTYKNKIAANKYLRNLTVRVGSKNYLTGFDPTKTAYTVNVPKKTKTIVVNGSRLMTCSTVTGNGQKSLANKTVKYSIKVKSATGKSMTYIITVVPKK